MLPPGWLLENQLSALIGAIKRRHLLENMQGEVQSLLWEERLLQVQGFCSDGRAVRGIFLWGLEVKRVVVLFRGRGFAFCRPLFG